MTYFLFVKGQIEGRLQGQGASGQPRSGKSSGLCGVARQSTSERTAVTVVPFPSVSIPSGDSAKKSDDLKRPLCTDIL